MPASPQERLAQFLERPPYGDDVAGQRAWLRQVMELLAIKGQPLALRAGLAASTINRFLSEKSSHRLRPQTLDAIVDQAARLAALDGRETTGGRDSGDEMLFLPGLKAERASAGSAQKCAELQDMAFSRTFLLSLKPTALAALCLVAAAGNAMAPTLADGDLLIVDRGSGLAAGDGLYLLQPDPEGAALARRITLAPQGGQVQLSTDNSLYGVPHTVDRDDLRILGRILWIGRRL